jgi:hypothetical protein
MNRCTSSVKIDHIINYRDVMKIIESKFVKALSILFKLYDILHLT